MAATTAEHVLTTERPLKMTYEEFLAWDSGEGLAEWVDGEVIIFMSAKARHQDVFYFLFKLITMFVDARRLGRVDSEPFAMRVLQGGPQRQPDIMFVSNEHLDRITAERLEGAADLVVEIVSDDSGNRDRDDKFAEYAAAGIPEYWIAEGREGYTGIEFYALQSNGKYLRIEADGAGRLHSRMLPGFWLDPRWLAADPLPSPYRVLRRVAPDAASTLFSDDDLSDL
jgi:Uma2 family endonuclease